MAEVALKQADRVSVTVLTDNYSDLFLLEGREIMRRPGMPEGPTPMAEHGLSLLLEVQSGVETHTVLMDASLSSQVLLHNLMVYGVDTSKIEGIILSHGHIDHMGGLMGFLRENPRRRELVAHPDAFSPRRFNIPGEDLREPMPLLNEAALEDSGVVVRKSRKAATWYSDLVLSLGEIERVTDFERGFPWAEIQKDGTWSVDPFDDDQAVVLRVAEGLVVISGCAHSGIVNTVKYAQKITGIGKVHAVLGGFHLTGPLFEPIIDATVAEMKSILPDYIAPMHCTGWKAINTFAREMGDRFFLNSVGTTYVFG
jgi:7,8-dihydropterin-6-yl-methyl-4-(beta-D-ribofuranosyl)aminobenzene 5'-phosphate synthase